jgi:uncharacterized SAM-binding protein YcdF (DUF218 family)
MKTILYAALSLILFLTSCGISQKSVRQQFNRASMNQYDAVIVPGVPFDGNKWQMTMQIRVHWSNYLFKKGITKNIIYSGGTVYSEYNEAKVMALYAKALGIPEGLIYVDTLAEHSTENVYYSYQVAKAQGFKKIALATDPFQSGSLKSFIKKHELPIDLIPIVFDTLANLDKYEPEIDPSSAQEENFVSIKKRESFFKRWRGTLGKQIIWKSDELPNDKLRKKYRRKNRCID